MLYGLGCPLGKYWGNCRAILGKKEKNLETTIMGLKG